MLFYEIKINYVRQTGEDQPRNEKETYLVEGLTCADAEKRLMDEIKPFIFGDCEVPSCKKVQLYDVIQSTGGDRWYKARVEVINIDYDGAESRKAVPVLIKDKTIRDALQHLQEYLSDLDCEVVSITRSPILDVFRAIN